MPQHSKPIRISTIALAACTLAAGCVTLPSVASRSELPPPSAPQQIHATWENRVYIAQDTVHNGAPLPGVAGRLYCFGPELGFPMRVRGELTVDLSDTAPVAKGGTPVLLERWTIDAATLDRLLKKDMIGWGYTLFLPWGSYKPDVRQVMLQAKFTPENGTPLFTPPAMVTLQPPDSAPRITEQTVRPLSRPTDPAPTQPLKVERLPWAR